MTDTRSLRTMAQSIRHRGPDDAGYLFGNPQTGQYVLYGDEDTPEEVFHHPFPYAPFEMLPPCEVPLQGCTLALANRRLSIVDIGPSGHQPMCNEDCSAWIVYNGEIYNAGNLREQLSARGHRFCSATDTEVVLHAYEEWGTDCLNRFNGMWAFAIWDVSLRQIFLSRDRTGIKPLYLWQDRDRFAFASEIKALLALDIPRQPNLSILCDFVSSNLTDHTEETFFQGISHLPQASALTINLVTGQTRRWRYWDLDPQQSLSFKTDRDYAESFLNLFEDAIRLHLISDVPVGTCLSGGLDSSAVACAINHMRGKHGLHVVGMESSQKVFSARWDDPRHDEGRHILSVVNRGGIEPHDVYPSPEDLRENWTTVFHQLEEPPPSASFFAQWTVFRLAKAQRVRVTLDGQGGDELLAGYLGFFPYHFVDLARNLRWGTFLAEISAYGSLYRVPLYQALRNVLSNLALPSLKASVKGQILRLKPWLSREFVRVPGRRMERVPPSCPRWPSALSRELYRSLTITPLPTLLRFDDRNSMAHSIESRVPFLDYRLIEFCFALPSDQKIRQGVTKYVLREAMQSSLPADILARHDKIGFTTPQDRWLQGPLAPWLREVFNSPEFQRRPYFNHARVLNMLDKHTAGTKHYTTELWQCLAIELWHRAMEV
jgi:asparagine synthase (glutamine-hydrolysing)